MYGDRIGLPPNPQDWGPWPCISSREPSLSGSGIKVQGSDSKVLELPTNQDLETPSNKGTEWLEPKCLFFRAAHTDNHVVVVVFFTHTVPPKDKDPGGTFHCPPHNGSSPAPYLTMHSLDQGTACHKHIILHNRRQAWQLPFLHLRVLIGRHFSKTLN